MDVVGDDRAGTSVRLVSYNVHDLRDDRDAVAHVLRSLRCDVACLQEVPRRWFQAPRVGRLARECGLRWASGGRASGGTAVLVGRRPDLMATDAYRLPVHGPLTRRRGAAAATIVLGDAALTAVSVHLPLRQEDRVTHARIIRARLAALAAGGPSPTSVVVAGDLNELPGGPAWEVLAAGLTDAALAGDGEPAPTFTARSPRRRIDAALVGPGAWVRSVPVPDVSPDDLRQASDHLPVVVDLVLGPVC